MKIIILSITLPLCWVMRAVAMDQKVWETALVNRGTREKLPGSLTSPASMDEFPHGAFGVVIAL